MMFPKPGARKKKGANTPKKAREVTAWNWFSKYIRLRDCNGSEYGRCFTCGRYFHWKNLHAGHYQSSGYKSTKFDEKNVHAQCVKCNTYREGEKNLYSLELDRRYGKGTARSLEVKAKIGRGSTALGFQYFDQIANHYRKKFQDLEKLL